MVILPLARTKESSKKGQGRQSCSVLTYDMDDEPMLSNLFE
jgi:hypothetical protein